MQSSFHSFCLTKRPTTLPLNPYCTCRFPSVGQSNWLAFHASSRQEDQAHQLEEPKPVKKGGLFGSGLSEWYALPIGLTAAIPIIKYEWYVINEETQLLAVFITFCITFYTQLGDAIYKSLDEVAVNILKEHTEAEEKVIEALEEKLEFLKANSTMVDDFVAINEMRVAAYDNLNAAGKVKPHHDFKAQVERIINMIAQEEQSVADKAKSALMEEATASVTAKFATSKEMKKAALDAAINKIKGTAKAGEDPVQSAFIQFFRDKATAAKKADDGAETAAQRAALVKKLNSVAQSERFFFQFDATGKPTMTV